MLRLPNVKISVTKCIVLVVTCVFGVTVYYTHWQDYDIMVDNVEKTILQYTATIQANKSRQMARVEDIGRSSSNTSRTDNPIAYYGLKPVPESSSSDFVDDLQPSVKEQFLRYKVRNYTDSVVILTPIHNVADKLSQFANILKELTYPHDLISVAFGEDCSEDSTLARARVVAAELRKTFKRVDVFHFDLPKQISGNWFQIHKASAQLPRRRHIAQSRNMLTKAGLKEGQWALWIDSDISYLPPDIIQQLLSSDKGIVVPACLYKLERQLHVFDKNTWRETPQSLEKQARMKKDELMLEGYSLSNRIFLTDLRAEGRVVPIDGVGGCTLLIKGDYHRNGLVFPEQVLDHHIETEGLAKLAKRMGYGVYGMPFIEVLH